MLYALFVFMTCFYLLIILYYWARGLEFIFCVSVLHQIPFVASDRRLRNAVAQEISRLGDVKSVCEIGAGYGGLARYVARKCGVNVVAIENMPLTFFYLKLFGFLPGGRRVKCVRANAFNYLKDNNLFFDVGVAYLGPGVNDKLIDVISKFKVLIVLDVPISNLEPEYVIDVGGGHTRYGRLKFPHKLFVYKS